MKVFLERLLWFSYKKLPDQCIFDAFSACTLHTFRFTAQTQKSRWAWHTHRGDSELFSYLIPATKSGTATEAVAGEFALTKKQLWPAVSLAVLTHILVLRWWSTFYNTLFAVYCRDCPTFLSCLTIDRSSKHLNVVLPSTGTHTLVESPSRDFASISSEHWIGSIASVFALGPRHAYFYCYSALQKSGSLQLETTYPEKVNIGLSFILPLLGLNLTYGL